MPERPHDIANILSHQSSSERSMAAGIIYCFLSNQSCLESSKTSLSFSGIYGKHGYNSIGKCFLYTLSSKRYLVLSEVCFISFSVFLNHHENWTCESFCVNFSYVQTGATTPNIVGPTMLLSVSNFAQQIPVNGHSM